MRITINQQPQTTLHNKETTVQICQNMLNQNTKKSPGIYFRALFNCTGEMGMDNFGDQNNSLYFYFVTNMWKKIEVRLKLIYEALGKNNIL